MDSKIFVSVFIFALFQGAYGCVKKFNNEKAMGEAMTACMEQLAIPADAGPNFQNYAADGFDDKCLAKCILKKLELLDDAENVDRDGAFDMLEEHAPKNLVNKLTESMNKCSESSGALKIDGAEKCKPLANFYGCFVTSADLLC